MPIGIYNQVATYWTNGVMDGFGKRTFATPRKIMVRWQDDSKLVLDAQGESISCEAIVWVQEDMKRTEYLALGDHTAMADPMQVDDAWIIFETTSTPSVSGADTIRKCFMKAGRR